jgi:hypothetical protein
VDRGAASAPFYASSKRLGHGEALASQLLRPGAMRAFRRRAFAR